MPNCYYVVVPRSLARTSDARVSGDDGGTSGMKSAYSSSSLADKGNDIVQCVNRTGGGGQVRKLVTDGKKIRVLVYYAQLADAFESLSAITECLEARAYEVLEASVGGSYEELGLNVPGYAPGSDSPSE